MDDPCPEQSGLHVRGSLEGKKVRVIYHEENQGYGAAVVTGYKLALAEGADVVVKSDGDGQMDPHLISTVAKPIA